MDSLPDIALRVETDRFGPFVFQIGVDASTTLVMLARVEDAHGFFKSSPLSQVANQLEKEILVSSIYGTNTIEGGRLTEEETAQVLDADPAKVKEEEARRVANIKRAYDLAQAAASDQGWRLDVEFICKLHAAITENLTSVEARNRPGVFRDNPKTVITEVGSAETGGRYRPPQFGRDIARLLAALVEWHKELQERGVPAMIRAPLFHLYFELIHPFWDGNGRVGRVLEATLLHAAGYRYAPFALARFYLDEIHRYFALFNSSRRNASKNDPHPNTDFVIFHLEGMLTTIKRLHHRTNRIVEVLLFENTVKRLADTKEINARQYAIISQVLDSGTIPLEELRKAPWYIALYLKRGEKTKQRDLSSLRKKGLLALDKDGRLWPGFVKLDDVVDPE